MRGGFFLSSGFVGRLKGAAARTAGWLLCVALVCMGGCKSALPPRRIVSTTTFNVLGLATPTPNTDLDVRVTPPLGWKPDPIKSSPRHKHQVWLSPTGHTAYGVIKFELPLPVGHDLALWGFLNEMRRTEGEATLVEKKWDPDLDGLRFVAEGGQYLVRTNLFVHGFTGWAVYAGTKRAEPIDEAELKLAESARENTTIGSGSDDRP